MKTLIVLLFFYGVQMNAQTETKDVFSVSKAYLMEIQKAVDYAPNTMQQKTDRLNRVIKQGTKQRAILEKQLQKTKSEKEQQEIIRDFNFILQSVIILKTDIQKNFPVSSEIYYLNRNIPLLLKKL